MQGIRKEKTYIVPGPDRLETVHHRNILPQIREQPEAGFQNEVGDTEENNTEDSHGEEQTQEDQESPTEVIHTLAQLDRPERVADESEDDEESKGGIDLAHDLAAFPEPNVVHIIACFLLRFNAYSPETLDAFAALLGRGVVMALVLVDLDDAESKHGHGKELESILEGGTIGDLWKSRVLGTQLLVGIGLESAKGTFDLTTQVSDLKGFELAIGLVVL